MDKRIKVIQGDITKQQVDAVVNAANSSLMGGGGVDGAIHRNGGKQILDDCMDIINRQGRCKTGEAVITTGGKLPARYVIHTVGPVWNGGHKNEPELLANCYKNSLQLAVDKGIKTIAFPNISTGIYHYPKPEAAEVALNAVADFLAADDSIAEVLFVCFDAENFELYAEALKG
jgi:O-acetyl-ADP-ribose deacetylase (regulator of RNase III)